MEASLICATVACACATVWRTWIALNKGDIPIVGINVRRGRTCSSCQKRARPDPWIPKDSLDRRPRKAKWKTNRRNPQRLQGVPNPQPRFNVNPGMYVMLKKRVERWSSHTKGCQKQQKERVLQEKQAGQHGQTPPMIALCSEISVMRQHYGSGNGALQKNILIITWRKQKQNIWKG